MRRALILVLCVTACSSRPPPFPHLAHLFSERCEPNCPTCTSCHDAAVLERGLAPPRERCSRCHRPDDERGEAPWSASLDPQGVRASLRFSHAQHLELGEVRGQCVRCHAGVVEDGAARFPTMQSCFDGCHAEERRENGCASCHEPSGLRALVPRTWWRHDAAFASDHGAEATSDIATCRQCHGESDCADCHDASHTLPVELRRAGQVERELLHRGDFLARHGFEARLAPASCTRCHTSSSCEGCHLERGVSGGGRGARTPHPLGWIGPDTASRDFHGRAARREVVTCAGCHEQGPATNCIRCHRVGGPGGNPHPDGWRSARSPEDAMCRYCHVR